MRIQEPRREARLDAGGEHVLCGSQHAGIYRCSREIGPILELELPEAVRSGRMRLVLDPEPTYQRAPHIALRVFRLPPGWEQRPDGAWDRYSQPDDELRYGHYRDVVAWWTRLSRLPRPLLHVIHADRPPTVPELPARVVCQRCRTISLLTADSLRVSSPLPEARLDSER